MIIPNNVTLHDWANSVAIDFPHDDVPALARGDNDWQRWGSILVQAPSFQAAGAISPYSLRPEQRKDWKGWAMSIYLTMGNNGS